MDGIRRAIPVVHTDDPEGTRAFYVDLLGFRVAMDQGGMLMLVSPSVPTTQVIIAWASDDASDPQVLRVNMSVEVADVDAAHADAVRAGTRHRLPADRRAVGHPAILRARAERDGRQRRKSRQPTSRSLSGSCP